MKRGKKKGGKYIKKGERGLKNASPWGIISNKFRGGASRRKLISWGKKNESKKRGGGNDYNAQYISL